MICASCHLTECRCRKCERPGCILSITAKWRKLRNSILRALVVPEQYKSAELPLLCELCHADRFYAGDAK